MISVAARNSSFSYKGTKSKVQQVASELGVDYVLEGSVRKAGNRIRVTAQLVDGKTDSHVWAERYDRGFDDIFDVQDELTRAIVVTISQRIEADSLDRARRKPPHNMDAYDCVLRGRELWLARRDRKGTAEARRYLGKAIKLDPDYAAAWGELAGVHFMEWNGAWTSAPQESLRLGLQCAEKAFALDPNDTAIVQRLGLIQCFTGNMENGWRLFKRALELNPHDPESLSRAGLALTLMGRHTEAMVHLERALTLDPIGYSAAEWFLGIACFADRQYGKAIDTLSSSRAGLAEVQAWLAAAYSQAGQLEEAISHGDKYLQAATAEMQGNQAEIPESWCAFLAERVPFKQDSDVAHFMEGLCKAGIG